jgi:hypothetical protein
MAGAAVVVSRAPRPPILQWLALAMLAACIPLNKWGQVPSNCGQPGRRRALETSAQPVMYSVENFKGIGGINSGVGDKPARVAVFVGVLSAGKNKEARDAIRATWGSHPALHSVRFILLRPRTAELLDEVSGCR